METVSYFTFFGPISFSCDQTSARSSRIPSWTSTEPYSDFHCLRIIGCWASWFWDGPSSNRIQPYQWKWSQVNIEAPGLFFFFLIDTNFMHIKHSRTSTQVEKQLIQIAKHIKLHKLAWFNGFKNVYELHIAGFDLALAPGYSSSTDTTTYIGVVVTFSSQGLFSLSCRLGLSAFEQNSSKCSLK